MRLKLYSSQRSQFPRNVDKSWGTHTSENPKQCVTGLVPRVLYHFWRLGGSLRMRLVGGWVLVGGGLWMRWPCVLSSTTAIIPTYTGGDDSSSWGLGKNEAVMELTSAILTLTPGVEGRKPGRHRANSSYPIACCGVGPPTWEGREGKRKVGDIQHSVSQRRLLGGQVLWYNYQLKNSSLDQVEQSPSSYSCI